MRISKSVCGNPFRAAPVRKRAGFHRLNRSLTVAARYFLQRSAHALSKQGGIHAPYKATEPREIRPTTLRFDGSNAMIVEVPTRRH